MADDSKPQGEARLIEHLIGSVLGSVVRAQGLAASQLVEMIDEVGFEAAPDTGERKTRTFSFDFFRNEVDDRTNEVVRKRVTASVPLLTLINLPTIAISEANIQMDLRLVAQQESSPDDPNAPLRLYAVPAKKQLVRSAKESFAIDSAGTVKVNVTMRQQEPLGLEKIQSLLEDATDELIVPELPADDELV